MIEKKKWNQRFNVLTRERAMWDKIADFITKGRINGLNCTDFLAHYRFLC